MPEASTFHYYIREKNNTARQKFNNFATLEIMGTNY